MFDPDAHVPRVKSSINLIFNNLQVDGDCITAPKNA